MALRLSTLIFLLTLVPWMTACTSDSESRPASVGADTVKAPAQKVSIEIPKQVVTPPVNSEVTSWLSEQVSITCALDNCPVQVGALYFLSPTTVSNYSLYRCTAFLIASDRIMTNGHCDFLDSAEAYFFTRTDAPERTFRKVTRRLYKAFTADKNPELSSGRPDIAVFQLESAILTIKPLALATGAPQTFTQLTAIVANSVPGKNDLNLTIGEVVCPVRRHARFFPFDLKEAPDMITMFDCESVKGNSGSPMFAPGSLDVAAVLQGASDLEKTAKSTREKKHRELLVFEKHTSVLATNVRCLDYPAPHTMACVDGSDKAAGARFDKRLDDFLANLKSRPVPAGSYQTGFSAYNFDIKNGKVDDIGAIEREIMYFPNCRSVTNVNEFVVPSEHIHIAFNEWAEPRVESLAILTSKGKIKSQSATSIQIEDMNWTQPFGTFAVPERDLRKQLGRAFSIALPPCSS